MHVLRCLAMATTLCGLVLSLEESCADPPLQRTTRSDECVARLSRWYWDVAVGACQDGIYFGCEATKNNFASLEECMQACESSSDARESTGLGRGGYLAAEFAELLEGLQNAMEGREREAPEDETPVDVENGEVRDANGREPTPSGFLEMLREDIRVREGLPPGPRESEGSEHGGESNVEDSMEDLHQYIVCFEPALHRAEGSGDCPGAWPSRRVHFNIVSGNCEFGVYRGCNSSKNNFKSMEECNQACNSAKMLLESRRTTPAPVQADVEGPEVDGLEASHDSASSRANEIAEPRAELPNSAGAVLDSNQLPLRHENCTWHPLHMDNGPVCTAYMERWYFDVSLGTCRRGVYGGCRPSPNNFLSWRECYHVCGGDEAPAKDPSFYMAQDLAFLEGVVSLHDLTQADEAVTSVAAAAQGMEARCLLTAPPVDESLLHRLTGGTNSCGDPTLLWYYDAGSRRCRHEKIGKPCDAEGNPINLAEADIVNAFQTSSQCSAACAAPGSLPEGAACLSNENAPPCEEGLSCVSVVRGGEAKGGVCRRVNVQNFCTLPPETGMCRAHFERWYYDPRKSACDKFIYGGCGGNENNFHTKLECEHRSSECATEGQVVASTPRTENTSSPPEMRLTANGECGKRFRAHLKLEGAVAGSAALFVRGRKPLDGSREDTELPPEMPCGSAKLGLHGVMWAKAGTAPQGSPKDRDTVIARVDAEGRALFSWPGYQPGNSRKCTRHEFQAVDLATCQVSNILSFFEG